jgi:serine/threonine protein kinase
VIYILKQVCASLCEAHCAGLVHRDIKPANIMRNRRGGEGDVVKVLDFGLVIAREEDQRGNESLAMAGTPLSLSLAVSMGRPWCGCCRLHSVS